MKKIITIVLSLLLAFALVGCTDALSLINSSTDSTTTNGEGSTTKESVTTTEVPRTTSPEAALIDQLELTEGDSYDINFWHIWGQQKSAVLDTIIAEFTRYMLDKYGVTVTINATAQSNYSTLLEKTTTAIASGDNSNIPNIVIGYPDHFADYLKSGKIVALDKYIDSTNYGVDRSDFIKAYMEENNQFDGITYSLPLSKSEEIMVYNKSALDACNIDLPYDRPLTWYEVYELWASLKDYKENYANFKYLLNYDSTDNMFINFARQWKAPYTTTDGQLLVTDSRTVQMLDYLAQCFQLGYLSVPLNYSDTANYGSEYFQQQQMPFTIGSTAGVSYDVPTALSADVKFLFEAGIAMVPQMTTDKNNANYSMSVVQQGPNIAILDAGSDEDDLVSWLLIKYLTSMDQYNPDNANANSEGFVEGQNNSARFGISTGYFPVTNSAYNSALYTEYMSIGKRYYEQGKSTEGFTEKEKANLLSSQVAYISYLQSDWLRFDPAFPATSTLFGSAQIRQNAGTCLEKIAKDNHYDPATALRELLEDCTINIG